MRQRIRFWLKLSAVIVGPVALVLAGSSSPAIEELRYGFRAMAIETFGSEAQQEQMVNDMCRRDAQNWGKLEEYERMKALAEAVNAQRRLLYMDEQLAELAVAQAVGELELERCER